MVGDRAGSLGITAADVEPSASQLGASIDAKGTAALVTWLDVLVAWNERHDLTAARSRDELLDLMLADAFALSSRVPVGARVVDVGAGAGAPGLALALARPDLVVTLVEPLAKRAAFLRSASAAAGRGDDVAVLRARVEDLAPDLPRWDVAVSRATLAPAAWLERGRALVRPGGSVWVLLAREPPPAPPPGLKLADDVAYVWPRTGKDRRAARYELA